MAEKTAIDELGGWEFLGKMMSYFGVRRATELFGYAIAAGLSRKELPSEIVAALMERGFSRAGVYRALADVKRFGVEMEKERGHVMSMAEVFAEINAASMSHVRDNAV